MTKRIAVGEKVYNLLVSQEDIQKGVTELATKLGCLAANNNDNLLVLGVSRESHRFATDLHRALGGNLVKATLISQEEYRTAGSAIIRPSQAIHVNDFHVVAAGINLGYPNIHGRLKDFLRESGAADIEIVSLLQPMALDPEKTPEPGRACLEITGIGHELMGYGLGPHPELPDIYAWTPVQNAA